ncbi:MAG: site-specific DNA-methyltransferase [Elusimicrobiota bacterium]|jgi:modification methylase|nr:site-specific DNA-methyltransferase [Elusimicrobiota bacterium]
MQNKISNSIIKGDTLEELKQFPNNFIDMGVTSPPYNKGEKNNGWLVKNVLYDKICDKKDETIYQDDQIKVLDELYRITKDGGSFFYNHKIRWNKGKLIHPIEWLKKTKWCIRQEIIWDRAIAGNIRGWRFWQVEERIYWLYKAIDNNFIGEELKSKHSLLTSIWRFSPEKNSLHPAPFPLQLPIRCIYSVMDDKKNGIIIDPYCGSGTTLVASKMFGYSYIGIDISQNYIDIAKNRIENYKNEIKIFDEEKNKHIVKKTFKERKEKGIYNHHDKNRRQELKNNNKINNNENFLF